MNALEAKTLSFGYGNREILRDIEFEIKDSSFIVLLGRNGSGKSTLLKLMAGIIKPRSGKIKIYGQDSNSMSFSKRAELIGFLSQSHNTVFPYSVEEVVITGRAPYIFYSPSNKDKQKALEAIEMVGIMHLKDKPYNQLSGGERQLVMIARVLAQKPKIILFDEPLTFLDIYNQIQFFELIHQLLSNNLTIIMVIHDLMTASRLDADYMMLLNGSIAAFGGKDVFTKDNIHKVFDIVCDVDKKTGLINLMPSKAFRQVDSLFNPYVC